MKRCIALLLILALCLCALPGLGEEADENDAMILQAMETLKSAWRQIYLEEANRSMNLNGILDIRGTRVIRFVEEPPAPMSTFLENQYGSADAVDCVIEFTGYVDYYGGGDVYYDELGRTAGPNSVVVLRSGEMQPAAYFFSRYIGLYYDTDFTPFMKELVDYGARYAGVFHLLEADGEKQAPAALDELEAMMQRMLEKVK